MQEEKKNEPLVDQKDEVEKVQLSRVLRFIIFLTFVCLSIVMSGIMVSFPHQKKW